MNIFEMLVIILTIAGAAAGVTTGASHGIAGIAIGLVIGAPLGFGSAYALIFCFAILCKLVFGGSFFGPRNIRRK